MLGSKRITPLVVWQSYSIKTHNFPSLLHSKFGFFNQIVYLLRNKLYFLAT